MGERDEAPNIRAGYLNLCHDHGSLGKENLKDSDRKTLGTPSQPDVRWEADCPSGSISLDGQKLGDTILNDARWGL